jgi:hypothetical protein
VSEKRTSFIAEMAVRVARAELERDLAIERAVKAEESAQQAHRAVVAVMGKDQEAMLDNLHIMGIPARDFKELYDVEHAYRMRNQADPV